MSQKRIPTVAQYHITRSNYWNEGGSGYAAVRYDDLHSDNNKLGFDTSLSERGQIIPGVGFAPNRHDVLTGSTPEGRAFPPGEDRTCRNWTSSNQGNVVCCGA